MGLAAYGKPKYLDELRQVIIVESNGKFRLNLDYFLHTSSNGVAMAWQDAQPVIGQIYSDKLSNLLGPVRNSDDPLEDKHRDIASSLQAMLEEAYFALLNRAAEVTGKKKLALAGGVGYNSVANGKIFAKTPFDDVYIQAAAGDAGTAIGAAFAVQNQELGNPRDFVMEDAYWGPSYSEDIVERALSSAELRYKRYDDFDLFEFVAGKISEGSVIGWFQDRMEWGPRALGNRSILADPRRADIRELLNIKIKKRESFRPFAPSILEESVGDFFDETFPDPFMLKVYPVREDKRSLIPAVVHVDGTGRLQTVSKTQNPRYWQLINAFKTRTDIPILLNTSFNENEPIVCNPDEAINAYLRTNMDMLVLGNYVVERNGN
jgi:carbamoyltransferase